MPRTRVHGKNFLTPEGGFAVSLTNKTGTASVKGQVVKADPTNDNAFITCTPGDHSIGVVYEAGVADGQECLVVTGGRAEVLIDSSSTPGNWIYVSDTNNGRGDASSTSPPKDSFNNSFVEAVGIALEEVQSSAGDWVLDRPTKPLLALTADQVIGSDDGAMLYADAIYIDSVRGHIFVSMYTKSVDFGGVGGPEVNAGAVFVYNFETGALVQTITATNAIDEESFSNFGYSTAHSGDWLLCGIPANIQQEGAEFFQWNGSSYEAVQRVTSDDWVDGDFYGNAVAIYGDYAAVSAYKHHVGGLRESGAVYIYKNNGGTWSQIQKIEPPVAKQDQYFGESIVMDDTHLVIAANQFDGDSYTDEGRVWIYERSGDTFGSPQVCTAAGHEGSSNLMGDSLSLNGNYLAIGYQHYDQPLGGSGAVAIWKKVSGTWTEIQFITVPNPTAINSNFGFGAFSSSGSVSLTDSYLLVGARGWKDNPPVSGWWGAAFLFEYNSTTDQFDLISLPTDTGYIYPETKGTFGASAFIVEDGRLAISAPQEYGDWESYHGLPEAETEPELYPSYSYAGTVRLYEYTQETGDPELIWALIQPQNMSDDTAASGNSLDEAYNVGNEIFVDEDPVIFSGLINSPVIEIKSGVIQLNEITPDPTAVSSGGLLYSMAVAGEAELFYRSSDGDITQITPGGGGGNTLDQAYDQGGAHAGRIINADDEYPVKIISDGGTARIGAETNYARILHLDGDDYGSPFVIDWILNGADASVVHITADGSVNNMAAGIYLINDVYGSAGEEFISFATEFSAGGSCAHTAFKAIGSGWTYSLRGMGAIKLEDSANGYIELLQQGGDPSSASGYGQVYTKEVSGVTELFYRDSVGNIRQITTAGGVGGGGGQTDTVAGSNGITNTGDNTDAVLTPTYGSSANTICQGNDARLSDSRDPNSHASSHQSGGGDAVKLDDLASPDDTTDLDATTGQHGLLPKLGGGTTNFLRADGSWASPPGGGGQTNTVTAGSGIQNLGDNVDAVLVPEYGSSAETVCEGNDSRLSDSRAPTAHDLAGVLHNSATLAELNNKVSDATLDDSSDPRDPNTHASTHASGQTDSIKLDDLHPPDDTTDLNADLSRHGLLPKLEGGTVKYLRADGSWAQPSGSGSGISSPLQTKGDIWGYDTDDERIPVGTSGQVLTAEPNAALGVEWKDPTAGDASPLTTKGDIYTYSTDNARLAIGTSGECLIADPNETTGNRWGFPKLDDLAAPDDNTDLDASVWTHGLLPKLGGGTTDFLRADGTWNAPPGGGGQTDTVTGASGIVNIGSDVDAILAPVFGNASETFCEGDDSRLSDDRTPLAHASTHASGQTDSIKLDDLEPPDDTTDLDANLSRHGLLPKLSGSTVAYLRGDGSWATPGGSSPLTTKGDIHGYSTTDDRLPVGTSGECVIADPNESLGIRYGFPKLDDLTPPDDNADLDATIWTHGLLPKLDGATDKYLRADGTWQTVGGAASPLTTKGDLWGYNTDDDRLPVGTSGEVLTVDPNESLGVKWVDPAAKISIPNEEIFTTNGTEAPGANVTFGPLSGFPQGTGTANTPNGYDIITFRNGIKMKCVSSLSTYLEFHYDVTNNEVDVLASGDADEYEVIYRSEV